MTDTVAGRDAANAAQAGPAQAGPAPAPAQTSSRRADILAAAAELFARHGFHGVSIGDLGRAVGLTGPALYRHFTGKDAVLAQILLDISERLLTEGCRRSAVAAEPAEALEALLHWHVSFALDNPALITVHERELDNVPEPERREIRRMQRTYVEEWVRVLRLLYPAVSQERARAAVHATFGLLNSTPHSAGSLDREAMGRLLYAMAAAALGGCAEITA